MAPKVKRDVVAESNTRIYAVREYVQKSRKKMTYQMIRRCARSLGYKSTMVVDALNALGLH